MKHFHEIYAAYFTCRINWELADERKTMKPLIVLQLLIEISIFKYVK